MAKKRKTLPKDFEDQLRKDDLDALKAVFDGCELDARGGMFKQSALGFGEIPEPLARWLVEQGADLAAGDSYGDTPLHSHAGDWRGNPAMLIALGADVNHDAGGRGTPLHRAAGAGHDDHVATLLTHGARPDARNRSGQTPLETSLQRCSNANIEQTAKVAKLLLEAGAPRTPRCKSMSGGSARVSSSTARNSTRIR